MTRLSWRSSAFLTLAAAAAAFSALTASLSIASTGSPLAAPSGAVPATKLVQVSAPAPKEDPAAPAGLRLYYASHSLMWDVPEPFTEEVKAAGIKNHEIVGVQRNGFSTTLQMWQQGAQPKAALETGKVDVFITSPMEMPDAGVDNFVEYGLKYNPKMKFYVQNNWAGFNMDGNLAHSSMGRGAKQWDQTTEAELKTLNTVCEKAFEDQVNKINEKYKKDEKIGHDVIWIIPTSQANTELRMKIIQKTFTGLDKQSDLFLDNIGHPKPPLVALNVYLHYATVYGKSPVGLPIPSTLKKANNPKFDEAFNKSLQELAWKTVTTYEFSGVKAPAAAK